MRFDQQVFSLLSSVDNFYLFIFIVVIVRLRNLIDNLQQ